MRDDNTKTRKRNNKVTLSPGSKQQKSSNYTKYGKNFRESQKVNRCGFLFFALSFSFAIFTYRGYVFKSIPFAGKKPSASLLDDIHSICGDYVWRGLIKEAELLSKITPIHVIEVGMHSATQCLSAAKKGLQAHCIEPSPASIDRIHKAILAESPEVRKNVRFYQMAASDASGNNLEFRSRGDTGDHVGSEGIDIWKMTKSSGAIMKNETDNSSHVEIVRSLAIDDIIYNEIVPTKDYAPPPRAPNDIIDKVFLLKVDTQGFEPKVFSGLGKAIRENKIDFIMTEYWPKGIDFINDSMGPQECTKPVEMLQLLHDAGYTLYALSIQSHPKAPKEVHDIIHKNNVKNITYPIDTFMAHCMWFYEVERDHPDMTDVNYQMGYWTDVLAVAPNVKLPKSLVNYAKCLRDSPRFRSHIKKCYDDFL